MHYQVALNADQFFFFPRVFKGNLIRKEMLTEVEPPDWFAYHKLEAV